MRFWLSVLVPSVLGQQYSAAYPLPNQPTPYTNSYALPPSQSQYNSGYNLAPTPRRYVTPPTIPPYQPPTRGKKGKQGKQGKTQRPAQAYIPPTQPYVPPTPQPTQPYVPPTPQPTTYVTPTPQPTQYVPPTQAYVPPTQAYVPPTPQPTAYVAPTPWPTTSYVIPQYTSPAPTPEPYQYNTAYITPVSQTYSHSDTFTSAYPLPPTAAPTPAAAPVQYSSAYQLPQIPVPVRPTPAPTALQVRPDTSLYCSESAVGCYQGHLRLCVPGQPQDSARIIRRCEQGCQTCPSGVPDACINKRYSEDICQTLANAHRAGRTCTRQQEGQVACFSGPDIGYCSSGSIIIVDYCGSTGCVGSPIPSQCNPLVSTPPPTNAATLPPLNPDDVCSGNYIFCWKGHVRLCLDKQPKDFAAILQDCRSQGCSVCPSGPDMCNDSDGNNVCAAVPRDRQAASCPAARQLTTYCDGRDVRHCDGSGRGVLVEFCADRGCNERPPICNAVVKNDNQICNGTYVLCTGGHVRVCRDGQPMAQTQVLHNCRNQGCSNCPNAPAICNDENRNSMCGRAPQSSFVQVCDAGVPPMTTYCSSSSDVRHCDPSGRAFLVEYCEQRGCKTDPLSCNAQTSSPPSPAPTQTQGNNNGGGGVVVGGGGGGALRPCSAPRIRREWGSLPDADRQLFINGLLELYRRGDVAQLAQFHYDVNPLIHGTNNTHFFIWHRVLLFDLEQRIRQIPGYECVTIPYWNYQYSNTAQARADRRSPFGTAPNKLGQGERAGCIDGPFAGVRHSLDSPSPHCIARDPADFLRSTLSSSVFFDLADIGEPVFLTFANNLQIAHGTPHVSFGNTFASHYSPIDPLFWVHHANIDRAWDIWQDCHLDYWWYEAGALNQPVVGYPGITVQQFIDNYNTQWMGQTYYVAYSSDDFQDPSAYSTDFRRNVATRCRDNRLRRYTSPNPILGIDDAWTKAARVTDRFLPFSSNLELNIAPQASIVVQETSVTLQCISRGFTTNYGPEIATYSNVSITECVAKCDKFFFRASGESNCRCTSTARRATKRVQISDSSTPIPRLAYFPACEGYDQNEYGFYDIDNAQATGRRLLQQRQTRPGAAGSLLRADTQTRLNSANLQLNAATGSGPSSTSSGASSSSGASPASSNAGADDQGLCYDQQTSNKQSAPATCSQPNTRPTLPREWLIMNGLSPDASDPCASFQPPVGTLGVRCVNQ